MKLLITLLFLFTIPGHATLSDEREMAQLEFAAKANQLSAIQDDPKLKAAAKDVKVDADLWLRYEVGPQLQDAIALHTVAARVYDEAKAEALAQNYLQAHQIDSSWGDLINSSHSGPSWNFHQEFANLSACEASAKMKATVQGVHLSQEPERIVAFGYTLNWRDGHERFYMKLNPPGEGSNTLVPVQQLMVFSKALDARTTEMQTQTINYYGLLDQKKIYTVVTNKVEMAIWNPETGLNTYTDEKDLSTNVTSWEYFPNETTKVTMKTHSENGMEYSLGLNILDSTWTCESHPALWPSKAFMNTIALARVNKFSEIFHFTEMRRRELLRCLAAKAAEECKDLQAKYDSSRSARKDLWTKLFIVPLPLSSFISSKEARDYEGPAVESEKPPVAEEIKEQASAIETEPPFKIPGRACTYVSRRGVLTALCDANLSCRFRDAKSATCSDGMRCQLHKNQLSCR